MESSSNDWDLDALVRSCGGGGGGMEEDQRQQVGGGDGGLEADQRQQFGGGGRDVLASVCQFVDGGPPVMGREAAAAASLYELEYLNGLVRDDQPFSITASTAADRERVPRREVLVSFPMATSTSGQPLRTKKQPGRKPGAGAARRPKRSKNKKSLVKKVVREVPVGDGGAGAGTGTDVDLWAWRKYGQKPIKGSPYPRGYYKCSSLKACKARKLVERSQEKPGVVVVTYISDHCHSVPTTQPSTAPRHGGTRSTSDELQTAAGKREDSADRSTSVDLAAEDDDADLWAAVEMDLQLDDLFDGDDLGHFWESGGGGGGLLERRVSL